MAVKQQASGQVRRIDASPTKEFFIHMLTRDIPLSRAILDLVDNSVDGARRLKPVGNYDSLWVRVDLNGRRFRISDNCGGIPVDVARNYAFRFGRPANFTGTPGSMGQFGVGMKRTFFRLGRHFSVKSTTVDSRFTVDVDVDEWMSNGDSPDGWHFQFNDLQTGLQIRAIDTGTVIEVDRLLPNVAAAFELENFRTRLAEELSQAHALTLNRELAISLNGLPVRHRPQELFSSKVLKPAYIEKTYDSNVLVQRPGPPVRVKLYAGVAERSLHDGGWYIFCNGRMVLRADQSAVTVWGDRHQMRAYHPDFANFRGFAYFDCDDGALLPWTTTKTGVDADAPVYRSVQREMIELTRPVIAFLSSLAKEKAIDAAVSPLADSIASAKATPVQNVSRPTQFVAPSPVQARNTPRLQRIQYFRPLAEVEKAKKLLRAKSYTAVGEKTFDYYMRYESGEKE